MLRNADSLSEVTEASLGSIVQDILENKDENKENKVIRWMTFRFRLSREEGLFV